MLQGAKKEVRHPQKSLIKYISKTTERFWKKFREFSQKVPRVFSKSSERFFKKVPEFSIESSGSFY